MSTNLKDNILKTVKESKCPKRKSRAKKAHRIKHKKNPYPMYSYKSGLRQEGGTPVWGIDVDWLFWELENGNIPDIFGVRNND